MPDFKQALRKYPVAFRLASAAYAGYLQYRYGSTGVPRPVNGEMFRIDPRLRMRFPPVHDPEVAGFLRSHIKPGATCFNVGANVGIMTLQMARWSAPNGTVVAFEPNLYARASLERHVRMNGLSDSIRVEPFAISNTIATEPMFVAGDDGMGRLGVANESLRDQAQAVQVPLLSLDEYCTSNNIIPDVIMMDIEGYEIEALEGARDLLAKHPNLIIVAEFHPCVWKRPKHELEAMFHGLGISPVGLTGQQDVYAEHSAVYFGRI